MYRLFLSLLILGISGCATNKFIGNSSEQYERLTCTLEEEICRINYTDSGYISYTIEQLYSNTYRVKGDVDIYMDVVGGMHPRVSFFVLFMDDESVQFERRVKTGTRKAGFEFDIETDRPILKTTIQKVLFHTRS